MGLPCLGNIRQGRQIDGRRERQIVFLRTASQAAGCRALITTVAAVFPDFFPVVCLGTKFSQEADYLVAFEPAVTPRSDAIGPDYSLITPAPQGIGMDV